MKKKNGAVAEDPSEKLVSPHSKHTDVLSFHGQRESHFSLLLSIAKASQCFYLLVSSAGKYFLKPPFLSGKFLCPLNPHSQAPTPGNLSWLPLPSPSQPRPLSKLLLYGTVSVFSHITRPRGPPVRSCGLVSSVPLARNGMYVAMLWGGLLNLRMWHETIESEFPGWTSRPKPKKQLSLLGRNRLSWVNQSKEQRQQLRSALLSPAASTSLTQVGGTPSLGCS